MRVKIKGTNKCKECSYWTVNGCNYCIEKGKSRLKIVNKQIVYSDYCDKFEKGKHNYTNRWVHEGLGDYRK